MAEFKEVFSSVYKGHEDKIPHVLLCLDPGETTGWSVFTNGVLTSYGQAPTYDKDKKTIKWGAVTELVERSQPTHIICENYRVYAHKLERHSFSEVPTLRIIGGLELLGYQYQVPVAYQMAVQAKGFVTDDRLRKWGFWKENMRHSRDAIRHGIYYLLITNRPKENNKNEEGRVLCLNQ